MSEIPKPVTGEPTPSKSTTLPESKSGNGQVKRARKSGRPNYAHIHSRPLPFITYPLPDFVPHNPLSIIRVLYSIVSHYLFTPQETAVVCDGYFSIQTRSIHVTDAKQIRNLWDMGFFGKGTLSRSEPTWLEQEKRRLGLTKQETSEEITAKRRKERQKLKLERARLERENVERQKMGLPLLEIPGMQKARVAGQQIEKAGVEVDSNHDVEQEEAESEDELSENVALMNQEHLQLSLEEAFFLVYALGALRIHPDPVSVSTTTTSMDLSKLLLLFRCNSYFPPLIPQQLSPDDPFILKYVVYHHFRSLGWVVRDGIKFAVDYLLYERGPVFKHADFALMIVPTYSDAYWTKDPTRPKTSTQRRQADRNLTWLHCVNRVQTAVFKTLVLVYVYVPAPETADMRQDIGQFLKRYKVREFCIRRWSANRNRD
jgi:tRNA-splicing endonuclease subunit Sen2